MANQQIECGTVVSMPFEQNTYIAYLAGASEAVIIDAGLEPAKIVKFLEKRALKPAAILVTHGHSDHIGGNGVIKQRWPDCQIVAGEHETDKLTDPRGNLSAMFGVPLVTPPADIALADGGTYQAAGLSFRALEIPGHSCGHLVYVLEGHSPTWVFVGDVIFAGSVGRTDFPDGDFDMLAAGIRDKLYTLPDDTVLYPGHGETTTVGRERRTNPFVPA